MDLQAACVAIEEAVRNEGYTFKVESSSPVNCNVHGNERNNIVGVDVMRWPVPCVAGSWGEFKGQQTTIFGQKEMPGIPLTGVANHYYAPGELSSGYLHLQTPDHCIYIVTISGFGNFPTKEKQLEILHALGSRIIPLLR